MSGTGEDGREPPGEGGLHLAQDAERPDGPPLPEALADVLASIRDLVSAETAARRDPPGPTDGVLMLTPAMRVDAGDDDAPLRAGEILTEGMGAPASRGLRPGAGQPAPILDEEALRGVINALVREELQGELGERISRNLRKLIRREMAQIEDERRDD